MKKFLFIAAIPVVATLLVVGAGFVMILGLAGGQGAQANAQSCDGFYAEPGDILVNRQALTELMDFRVNAAHYAPGNPYGYTSRDDIVQERVWVVETAVKVGHNRPGGSSRYMLINLMGGMQESKFQNLVQADSDRDSNGYMQQRPSQGWGTVAQLRDPVYATNAFYDALMNVEGRERMELGEVVQAVQRSAFPDAYDQWEQLGRDILEQGFGIVVDDTNTFQTSEEFLVACAEAVQVDASSVIGSAEGLAAELERRGYRNGRLDSILVEATPDCMLANINGAPQTWTELMQRAEDQGTPIRAGGCNRTFERQEDLYYGRKCYIVGNCDGNPWPPTAVPGTSNHGWALAIDIWNERTQDSVKCGDPELVWLQQNAPEFGWKWPEWAHCGESSQEGWHWEYDGNPIQVGGTTPSEPPTTTPASFGHEYPGDTAVMDVEPSTLFISTELAAVMAPAITTDLHLDPTASLTTFSPSSVTNSFALARNATHWSPGRQKEKLLIKRINRHVAAFLMLKSRK